MQRGAGHVRTPLTRRIAMTSAQTPSPSATTEAANRRATSRVIRGRLAHPLRLVDDQRRERRSAARGDLEREAPLTDHDQRRRGARVDAGADLAQRVLLLGHLHLEVIEQQRHGRAADRCSALGDPQRKRVGRGGLVGGDEHLQAVTGPVDGRRHAPRTHLRQRRVLQREGGRRGRETREDGGREHGAGDDDRLAADQPAQAAAPRARPARAGWGLPPGPACCAAGCPRRARSRSPAEPILTRIATP